MISLDGKRPGRLIVLNINLCFVELHATNKAVCLLHWSGDLRKFRFRKTYSINIYYYIIYDIIKICTF